MYVEQGTVPPWFERLAVEYCRTRGEPMTLDSLTDDVTQWDHFGQSVAEDGSELMVSEPYSDLPTATRFAEQVCARLRIKHRILPEAWHSTRAIRIEFFV